MATTKKKPVPAQGAAKPATATRATPTVEAKVSPAARTGKVGTPMALAEVMAALEQAGSATTKKTYLRHGAKAPLFGVSFATLKDLRKRIGVDHALALGLWASGNFDARNLAVKVVDPAKMKPADLDRWAKESTVRMCTGYVAAIASEGPHGLSRAEAWLASTDVAQRAMGWSLVGALAMGDVSVPAAWFLVRTAEIERTLRTVSNEERSAMNHALISIGGRDAALRKAATAAAKRIGRVDVDHGDTACKTPDATASIEKAWAHSVAKGFDSPAAHERSRESMRIRC